MKLVRRARYCSPIAVRKREAAEVCCHLEFYDISSPNAHATCLLFHPTGCCLARYTQSFAGHLRMAPPNRLRQCESPWLPREHFPRICRFFESNLLPAASDTCNVEGFKHESLLSGRACVSDFCFGKPRAGFGSGSQNIRGTSRAVTDLPRSHSQSADARFSPAP